MAAISRTRQRPRNVTFAHCSTRAQGPLDERTGHAVRTPAEVALWERVEAGPLVTDIEAHALRYRADPVEVAGEAGKEFVERLEASAQQRMRVSILRCTAAVRRSGRERIKFADRDAFEVIAQGACTRQTGDAGADDDRVFPERPGPRVHRAGRHMLSAKARTSNTGDGRVGTEETLSAEDGRANQLAPIRHPQQDLFLAQMFDAALKDDQASMEHPMFSLSKTPDLNVRVYEHNGNSITITPSANGLATIWDKDVLLFAISTLIEAQNRGIPTSRNVRLRAHDLLVYCNRGV